MSVNPMEIAADLGTVRIGHRIICLAEIDSTNDVCWNIAQRGNADGLVVVADWQRRGRGQGRRTWQTQPGEAILLSVLLLNESDATASEIMPSVASIAVAGTVDTVVPGVVSLKWPNDVLIDGAKLAGILVEHRTIAGQHCVVIGIGMNVFAAPSVEEIGRRATCLADHAAGELSPLEFTRTLLRRLDAHIADVTAGRIAAIRDTWISYSKREAVHQ
ncbi:MAG: biotin--[acetyl-CoA-carboxylase] ligase [Pirellulales bacterium]|nr:biotin--[acetyl-CoA-carboxylase] ligase [Pirellulales bacterium]